MHSEQTPAATEEAASAEATPSPERAPEADLSPAEPAASAGSSPAEPAESAGLSPAECGARLAELFPALFVAPGAPGPFKPIKLRVHADILERAPGVFSKRVLGIFFSRYTTSNGYLKALVAEGAQRFDLDGQPAGAIADEHRAAAIEELARRRAIAAERRAAQRKTQTPAALAAPTRAPDERAPRPPQRREHPLRRDDSHRAQRMGPARRERALPRERQPAPQAVPRREAAVSAPAVAAMPADPAQRERALLLRAFESSPLSKANFCALKRLKESELDALLDQARAERGG
jgi:sRNA-binding protein